ncbi:uncharacterized protein LOC110453072 [Mizuhopecten yessoensis]|uniref:Collagen alpha-1(XXI) chain n=1 Tax=Mizuhopecten yessoensis TaxID=6573 RepID=A0A210QII4_MIZYE|nr:uncharacterized protein LOC110453072 [Mizuhopecten yessoensis]OWF48411.1 Collagen alpha-1(XXI) chain [Mizuhopecten yessoensis]
MELVICLLLGITVASAASPPDMYGEMQVDSHDWTIGHNTLGERNPIPRGCSGKPADVFLVFDTSGDVTPAQLAKQKKYAIDLLRVFTFGDKSTRISVVTYADEVMNVSSFEDGTNIGNATSTIMYDVPLETTGPCKIDKALQYISTDGFSNSSMRREVAHLAILFVGNRITNRKEAKRHARDSKAKGMYLYTVGQSTAIRKQLSSISSRPAKTFVFSNDDDRIVQSLKDLLKIHLCEFQIEPPASLRRPSYCHVSRPVDLIFSVDEISIGARNAQKIFNLIEFLMLNINNQSNGLKVGLVSSKINFKAVSRGFSTVEDFSNRLSSVAISDHGDIIKRARRMLRRGRANSQKTIIHFVDSNIDITKHALFEAKKNKRVKLETFVIATGSGLDQRSLEKIASHHSSQHVFLVKDYHMMASVGPNILKTVCASW